MKTKSHQVSFCVVGGGLAGMCAAIAAARHGVKTVLIQDRPVLGGNASSEIRMWVCGAHNNLETGLIEEIRLENLYRNTYPNYSVWDTVLYEKARFQENLTLLLNCTCNEAVAENGKIRSVKAWQMTTETFHVVEAEIFADCSGDGILAPLTGADFRIGREAKAEFGESLAQDEADSKTMGLSCLIQARETDRKQVFTPPSWIHHYPTEESLPPGRSHNIHAELENFWYLELGGNRDSIGDTEEVRDELLKTALGLWDHIKNHGDHGADNWVLDWIGFLPGKRESRRLMGDVILTQQNILDSTPFDDIVAYGGWPVDDHHPDGFEHRGEANISILPPKPYPIPLRCLYSRNIANLMFAGRNISCSHVAISSTRVMATCACLGQAVGTAAVFAVRNHLTPRETCEKFIRDIQNMLMDDDCYLPGLVRPVPELCRAARLNASAGNPEELRTGRDRETDGAPNAWLCRQGDWAEYDFGKSCPLREVRLVFDSDLTRNRNNGHLNMIFNRPLNTREYHVSDTLVRAFHLEADGKEIFRTENNYQRLVRIPVNAEASRLRLVIDGTRGGGEAYKVFAFEAK